MMEYYLTIKRNEVLIHATICMNPENIMHKEVNHKKPTYSMTPFI